MNKPTYQVRPLCFGTTWINVEKEFYDRAGAPGYEKRVIDGEPGANAAAPARDIQIDREVSGYYLYDADGPDTAPALARMIPTKADAERFAAVDQLIAVARGVAGMDDWQQISLAQIEQAIKALAAAGV
jgi:hypothetical protein